MKKQLILVVQEKGGIGKSVASFIISQIFERNFSSQFNIYDLDDGTRTTCKQLAYLKPIEVSFLNADGIIDRGLLNIFIQKVSGSAKKMHLADLGAPVSQQLPQYLHDVEKETLVSALELLEIDLTLLVVVGGGSDFASCMDYLERLYAVLGNSTRIVVGTNSYFHFSETQKMQFAKAMESMKLQSFDFTLSNDKQDTTQNTIKEMLVSGKGLDFLPVLIKLMITKNIQKIETKIEEIGFLEFTKNKKANPVQE